MNKSMTLCRPLGKHPLPLLFMAILWVVMVILWYIFGLYAMVVSGGSIPNINLYLIFSFLIFLRRHGKCRPLLCSLLVAQVVSLLMVRPLAALWVLSEIYQTDVQY